MVERLVDADGHRTDCRVMQDGFFCSCDLRARREEANRPALQKAREENLRLWEIQKAEYEHETRVHRLRRFFVYKTPVNAVFLLGLYYVWWLTLPLLAL